MWQICSNYISCNCVACEMWPGHAFMRFPYTRPNALTESDSVSTLSHHLLVTETDTKHLCSPAIILPSARTKTLPAQRVLHTQTLKHRCSGTDVTHCALWDIEGGGKRSGRSATQVHTYLQCSSLQTTKTTEIKWKADWCYWLKKWVWRG